MADLAEPATILGRPSPDYITAIPSERDGEPLLTLERRLFGRLRRVELIGAQALRAWEFLSSAFDGDDSSSTRKG